MPRLSDTSPEAEKVLAECYRRMPSERKWKLLGDAYRYARVLHAAGLRDRRPEVTDSEVHYDWAKTTLGEGPWLERMRSTVWNQPLEHQDVIRNVIEVFNKEGIAYAVGGSLASSYHGYPRYTQDADLTALPFPGKEAAFAAHFDPAEYYCDLSMIRDAVRRHSSFNLIHYGTGFKVDIFIRKDRPFDLALWLRRVTTTKLDPSGQSVEVISAEDMILLKLEWYRIGGETSDRQWNDVLGILRTKVSLLDNAYLDHWATNLGVMDLLIRARSEV